MKKFLAKIYAFAFLDDFVLIYPLYAVMFTEFKMEPWQVAALFTVWSSTTFLLEIPSGVWADRYSRKKILLAGQLLKAVGFTIWMLFPTFIGFLSGFILWGIQCAFISGTFQALIYDELKLLNEEKQYTKISGRTKSFSLGGILLASVLASPAVFLGYPFILIVSASVVLAAGMILQYLPEAQKIESLEEKEQKSMLKKGFKIAFKQKSVFKIILFISIIYALDGGLEEFYPILANNVGLPKYALGLFIALICGVQGLAGYLAYHFEKRSNRFFYLLFLINGLLLTITTIVYTVPSLVFILMFGFLFTIVEVVFEARLQHAIESETRATVSSVLGALAEVSSLAVFLAIGMSAQISKYQTGFMILGLVVILFGLFYLVSSLKSN